MCNGQEERLILCHVFAGTKRVLFYENLGWSLTEVTLSGPANLGVTLQEDMGAADRILLQGLDLRQVTLHDTLCRVVWQVKQETYRNNQ